MTLLNKAPAGASQTDPDAAPLDWRRKLDLALDGLASRAGAPAPPPRANDTDERPAQIRSEPRPEPARPDPMAVVEQRFAALSARIDADRAAVIEQVGRAVAAQLQPIESALAAMGARLDAAEQKSADAVRAIIRTGEALAGQVDAVRQHADAGLGRLGAEMARLSHGMEAASEQALAAAEMASRGLDAEIARTARSLTAQVADAEQRAVSANADVAQGLAELGAQLEAWREQVSTELVEHIHRSEMRAALLLEDARQRVQRELTEPAAAMASPAGEAAAEAPAVPFGRDRRSQVGRRWTDRDQAFWRA